MTAPNPHRVSISFSIAYARVAQWISNPIRHERPKPEELEQAKAHALRVGDPFMIEQIEEIEEANFVRDSLPTPKLPPAGEDDWDEPTIKTFGIPRIPTQSYDTGIRPTHEIIIPPPPDCPDAAELDKMLDEFLRNLV